MAELYCGSFGTASFPCCIGAAAVGVTVFRGANDRTGATIALSRGTGRFDGFFNTPL